MKEAALLLQRGLFQLNGQYVLVKVDFTQFSEY